MAEPILIDKQKDIAILTLNRPDKRNALSPELIKTLHGKIEDIAGDNAIHGVILTGAGNAFCAGADLAYLKEISEYSDEENLEDSRRLAVLFHKLYTLPKITLALVNGPALAGGCGLALCCDWIFADQNNAKFGFTEVRIGFIPAIVLNFLIRRVKLSVASDLSISGQMLTASQALSCGLVNETAPPDELKNRAVGFMNKLLDQNSFTAMMETKKLFHQLMDVPLNTGLELASEANAASRKTTDCQIGLHAFLNKEKIQWRR